MIIIRDFNHTIEIIRDRKFIFNQLNIFENLIKALEV